jgi:hypothetical protein
METGRLTYWQVESLVVEGHLHIGKDICRKAGLKNHKNDHKNENFFGFDLEFCSISLLVMQ